METTRPISKSISTLTPQSPLSNHPPMNDENECEPVTLENILAELDALEASYEFPCFRNARYETLDARMHLVRSPWKWALLIEEAVHWPGAGGPQTILFGAGTLLGRAGGLLPFRSQLSVTYDARVLDEPAAATLRDTPVDMNAVRDVARREGINANLALLFHLRETERARLFRDAIELAPWFDGGEPLLTIDAWCHPPVYEGRKPSQSQAFQMAAEVLVTGDVSKWAPTEAPNNRSWHPWGGPP